MRVFEKTYTAEEPCNEELVKKAILMLEMHVVSIVNAIDALLRKFLIRKRINITMIVIIIECLKDK